MNLARGPECPRPGPGILIMTETPEIKYLFEPRAVAVIGASHSPGKVGYQLLDNIRFSKFPGRVYPINPKGGEILGYPVYGSLSEVKDEIDLACIAVPARLAISAVEECAKKRVKFIAVITSGFAEAGKIEEERRMVAIARASGMRILGPNIFGIFSASAPINATFGPKEISAGRVAIITQSGALGIAMIGKTRVEKIGLSAMVSVGNKSDLDESDLLEYLIGQEGTKIIMIYIEGVKDGDRFVRVLKRASQQKPVVVIKAGRSRRGALAAASHTGSLTGSDQIFEAIVKQSGALRAESLEEAFNWTRFLADAPLPQGENAVILTNGGGIGVMATDACEKYRVNLYDDPASLRETFAKVTPDFGSLKNPIDLTGQAQAVHYRTALDSALSNPNIHSVISLYCETAMFDYENLAPMIAQSAKNYLAKNKPLVFSLFGGERTEQAVSELRRQGIPVFPDVYQAVSCLGALYAWYRHRTSPPEAVEEIVLPLGKVEELIQKVRTDNRSFLLAPEAKELMRIMGIPGPATRVARNLDQAVNFAEQIGYPVVMKIVSKDIIHKSDVGGVALDLLNKKEVIDAYEMILHNCRRIKPEARIEGVEISEMMKPGIEVIIGARNDKIYGPILIFGMGGKYVEVMKDTATRSLPLSRKEIMRMLEETKAYTLLLGVRGEKKKDLDAVVDTILKLGALVQKCRSISDLEINPLVVYDYGQGAKALDTRVLLGNP